MEIIVVAGRLILAAVFLVAGLAKLADLPGSRKSAADFGVPAALVPALGALLPVAELAAAIALPPASTGWWGAAGALALLLVFIAGICVNLARGRAPDCHCFGQLHSAPIGWKTLARNAVLSGAAVAVLRQGREAQPTLLGWTRMFDRTELVMIALGTSFAALLALSFGLWLQLIRQNGRLLLRIEAIEEKLGISHPAAVPAGLPPGSPAPDFTLAELDGGAVSLADLRAAGKPVLLLFIEPGCGPCDELLPEAAAWQAGRCGRFTPAIISRGGAEANRERKTRFGLGAILLQKDRETAEAYDCSGTPAAVLVDAGGTIARHAALGADAIRALVRPGVGEGAPAVRLPDLAGRTVDLESLRGCRAAVLFWNPQCGFCQGMLDDIKAWERGPADGLRLLVVSTGRVEDNRAQGFRSTVLLDEGFRTGRAFGADGTPSAVLVDEAGRIASSPAAGAASVMELIRSGAL